MRLVCKQFRLCLRKGGTFSQKKIVELMNMTRTQTPGWVPGQVRAWENFVVFKKFMINMNDEETILFKALDSDTMNAAKHNLQTAMNDFFLDLAEGTKFYDPKSPSKGQSIRTFIMDKMINWGYISDLNIARWDGKTTKTALILACIYANARTVRLLLHQQDVDVDWVSTHGGWNTAFSYTRNAIDCHLADEDKDGSKLESLHRIMADLLHVRALKKRYIPDELLVSGEVHASESDIEPDSDEEEEEEEEEGEEEE